MSCWETADLDAIYAARLRCWDMLLSWYRQDPWHKRVSNLLAIAGGINAAWSEGRLLPATWPPPLLLIAANFPYCQIAGNIPAAQTRYKKREIAWWALSGLQAVSCWPLAVCKCSLLSVPQNFLPGGTDAWELHKVWRMEFSGSLPFPRCLWFRNLR